MSSNNLCIEFDNKGLDDQLMTGVMHTSMYIPNMTGPYTGGGGTGGATAQTFRPKFFEILGKTDQNMQKL